MKVLSITGLLLLALNSVLWLSCGDDRATSEVKADSSAVAVDGPGEHEGHGDVEHGAEASDLDLSVQELLEASCEHERKTYTCEECRYEVGVARAPRDLFKDGTLRLASLEKRAVESAVPLTGQVAFDEERVSHVSAVVSGVVRRTHVRLGSRVGRGQLLLEIESAEAAEAQERFLEAEAEERLAQREHERVADLRAQEVSSEREFQRSRQELELARLRVETARGRLSWLGLDPAAVRAMKSGEARGLVALRAPEAGVVLSLHAVPGESVHPEEALATVGDSRALWVWCDVYERDLASLGGQSVEGRTARIRVQAWPGETFVGRVDFLSPALDTERRTARLRVAVDNGGQRLMAGMFAQVEVFQPGSETVAALPEDALLEDEGRFFVFVPAVEDYFVRRPVTPGRRWAGWVELLSAPEGMDKVVAQGCFLLKSDVLRSKMGAGCAD